MPDILISILLVLFGLVVGIIVMFIFHYIKRIRTTEKVEDLLGNARVEAEKIKTDYLREAKEEANQLTKKAEEEIREKKNELKKTEQRLDSREENIDRRDQSLQNREALLEEKENNLINKQNDIQDEQAKVEEIKKQQ